MKYLFILITLVSMIAAFAGPISDEIENSVVVVDGVKYEMIRITGKLAEEKYKELFDKRGVTHSEQVDELNNGRMLVQTMVDEKNGFGCNRAVVVEKTAEQTSKFGIIHYNCVLKIPMSN